MQDTAGVDSGDTGPTFARNNHASAGIDDSILGLSPRNMQDAAGIDGGGVYCTLTDSHVSAGIDGNTGRRLIVI